MERFHDDKLTPLRSRLIKMRIFFEIVAEKKVKLCVLIDLKVADTSECEAGSKVCRYAMKLCRVSP